MKRKAGKYDSYLNKKLKKYNKYKNNQLKRSVGFTNYKVKKFNNLSKKKKIIILLMIFLLILLILFIKFLIFPRIILTKADISIKLGEKYTEAGYKSETIIKDFTKDVVVKNNINNKVVGKYEVKYKVKYGFITVTKIRKVNVIDDIKPVIEIAGEKVINVCPNYNTDDYAYTAKDNYDGDITKKVKRIKKGNIVTYTVKDSSGNEYSVSKEFIKIDTEKPTIILNGNPITYVYKGSVYTDSGFTASDNCDGDLSSKVSVTGAVNTSVTGQYNLTYSVTDSSNNTFTISRNVIVYYAPPNGYADGKIYLTFDDGPSLSITPQLLDILKEENVKATFFVTGISPAAFSLITREYNEGHTVALHTYTHNYQTVYTSTAGYFNDLQRISDLVKSLTGTESKIIRFPGGSSNTVSRTYCKGIMSTLANEVTSRGYIYFDWNNDSKDASSAASAQDVYNNVISQLSHYKTNVVLMHDRDNKYYTLNAIRNIIKYGKANGYEFAAITTSTPRVVHTISN